MDAVSTHGGAITEEAVTRKVMRRIIPFIFVCYVVSDLDRINVGMPPRGARRLRIGLAPESPRRAAAPGMPMFSHL